MNVNYEQTIIDAIELIIDKKLSQFACDKTIIATVMSYENDLKYTLQFQDVTFTAYALSNNTIYTKGQQVYVLIPQNDFSNKKFILGVNS